MESAVALANTIHRTLALHPNKKPSNVEMRLALQTYQDSRLARVKEIFNVSWMLTRLQAYDGWLMYLVQRWVMPVIGLDFVAKNVARTCSEAPKLDYVEFEEESGTLGWKEKEAMVGKKAAVEEKKRAALWYGGGERILPMVFGGLVLFSSALWWLVGGQRMHVLPGFAVVA